MQALPKVPTVYAGPLVKDNGTRTANPRVQTFVVTNNAHVRNTNPGYSRSDAGRFYCHWNAHY